MRGKRKSVPEDTISLLRNTIVELRSHGVPPARIIPLMSRSYTIVNNVGWDKIEDIIEEICDEED